MKDGDIDYSQFSAGELREALAGIRRDMYPMNYANILAALGALNEQVEPVSAATSVASAEDAEGLADRGVRLGAVLIDGVIILVVVLPVAYISGFWQLAMHAATNHEKIPAGPLLAWTAFNLVAFALIQGYPLVRDGQTWGKKLASIKIVDMQGEKPAIPRILVRYAIIMLVRLIPIVGRLASLVDILLIFRNDRRCGHDLLAGTRVVNAVAPAEKASENASV